MAGYSLKKLVLSSTVLVSIFAAPMSASAHSKMASVYSGGWSASSEFASSHGLTHRRFARVSKRRTHRSARVRLARHHIGRSVQARINDRDHFEHSRATATSAGASGQSGIASVYSGGLTADGEHASSSGLTAAHRTLPFGTLVRVTNQSNGRAVTVRINDRGPFVHGRVIDLTPAGAHALGFAGLAHVTLTVVGRS
jgi:rare lipoprotein A